MPERPSLTYPNLYELGHLSTGIWGLISTGKNMLETENARHQEEGGKTATWCMPRSKGQSRTDLNEPDGRVSRKTFLGTVI